MRVLIQQIGTGFFLKPTGGWTDKCEQAMDFRHATDALNVCVLNKLSGVQIVLKFSDPVFDIAIPIAETRRSEDRL
ncbi:MAG: hypothetical protein ACTHLW_21000 [Verrucomicrobiota bacterium]